MMNNFKSKIVVFDIYYRQLPKSCQFVIVFSHWLLLEFRNPYKSKPLVYIDVFVAFSKLGYHLVFIPHWLNNKREQ